MLLLVLFACADRPEMLALGAGHGDWEGCEALGEGGCTTTGLLSIQPGFERGDWTFEVNGERGTIHTPTHANLAVFDGVETTISVNRIGEYGNVVRLRSDTDHWLMDIGRGLATVPQLYPDVGGVSFGEERGTSSLDGETLTWHDLRFESDTGVAVTAEPGVPTKLVRREQTWEVIVVAAYQAAVPNKVHLDPEDCAGLLPMLAYELRLVDDDWEPDGRRRAREAEEPFASAQCRLNAPD